MVLSVWRGAPPLTRDEWSSVWGAGGALFVTLVTHGVLKMWQWCVDSSGLECWVSNGEGGRGREGEGRGGEGGEGRGGGRGGARGREGRRGEGRRGEEGEVGRGGKGRKEGGEGEGEDGERKRMV